MYGKGKLLYAIVQSVVLLHTYIHMQVIAQVVKDLNKAAADEIRSLIREDKVDEARKIDPNNYQNIVDVDEIFRCVCMYVCMYVCMQ